MNAIRSETQQGYSEAQGWRYGVVSVRGYVWRLASGSEAVDEA